MLRVGLDLRPTEPGFKAHWGRGTGRYAQEVSRRLLDGDFDKSSLQYVALDTAGLMGQTWEQTLVRLSPLGKVTLETQLLLPGRLRRTGVNLVHFFSHGDAPARSSVPYVVTVLDLIPLRFESLYRANKPGWRFRLARYLELQAIRQARGIVAISECTKRDVVELLGVPAEKVFVTPLGVDRRFRSRPLSREDLPRFIERRKAGFGIPADRPVLLYVGGIDPRKNVTFLLRLVAELLSKRREGGRPMLVMAGRYEQEESFPSMLAEISALGIEADVKLLGFLPEEQLSDLYHTADLFIFPSLYEGFGLPVLEAMACGVPVLCGHNSSLPEVAGGVAFMKPDGVMREWLQTIEAILLSRDLQISRGRAGVVHAERFCWENTAMLTAEAHRYFLNLENPCGKDRAVEFATG